MVRIFRTNTENIAATGTQLGQIYDVTCNKSGKATEIHGSSDAWEKNSLTGVEFDEVQGE